MAEWFNHRIADLSPATRKALDDMLAASKLASQLKRDWQAALTAELGKLPPGKRYAVNLNLKWQQVGTKIVDEEEAEAKPEAKAKQSFAEWKAAQLNGGHAV